jgi:UDPglucose--hexose-1-phosphate uridylyltransferase
MSELRRNPITGLWVIVAENRGARPQEIFSQQTVLDDFQCPFCEGREERTPNETLARRQPGSQVNGPGWRVRVVPNKYPALEEVGDLDTAGKLPSETGNEAAVGLHEIIVESPRHLTSVTELEERQFAEVLDVYRQRLGELRSSGNYRGAVLFKNAGPAAGATLSHLHSQLMASFSAVPYLLGRAKAFERSAKEGAACPVCKMLQDEVDAGQRILARDETFTAFCPYASRLAYETWIVPNRHGAHFDLLLTNEVDRLAAMFRSVLVKVEAIVKLPAYNYIVHTAPFDSKQSNHYHWHIEILPRTSNLAGLELGTGCYLNTVSPEHAADVLRRA